MCEHEKYDISNLAFIYNTIVSFVNNICLDLDVINQLGKFKLERKINEQNYDLYHFLERRTYLSLVVTLDTILDDTNSSREENERIHNASLNVDKLLCSLQDSFRYEKDKKCQTNLNKCWSVLKNEYDSIQAMPERKKLATFRNKLAAHVDIAFIKKDPIEGIDLSPQDYAKIIIPLCNLIQEIGSMIVFDGKDTIKPYGSNRKTTPIDDLF